MKKGSSGVSLVRQSSFPGQLPNSSDPIPGIWKECQVRRPLSESLPSAPFKNRTEGGPREKSRGKSAGFTHRLWPIAAFCRSPGSQPPPLLRTLDGWQRWLFIRLPTLQQRRCRRLVLPPLFFLAAPAFRQQKLQPRGERDFRGRVAKQSPKPSWSHPASGRAALLSRAPWI